MARSTDTGETLEQALRRCYGDASKSLYSQAQTAARSVSSFTWMRHQYLGVNPNLIAVVPCRLVDDGAIKEATASWYQQGISPATINKRLNCLSKMGVSVEGLRVKNPKKLKWYLSEEKRCELLLWLRNQEAGIGLHILADFIAWTTRTGLRVEETLRLTWGDITSTAPFEIRVPGTKTVNSQATLPLGRIAEALIRQRRVQAGDVTPSALIFPVTYLQLQNAWDHVRNHFGWKDDPTATLKALRRSAARYLHVDCGMPLHMVQQYLRHESMDTTLEYLRLTGGYGTEEMRRYLK